MGNIITLPDEVSLKIAAGEVIEGPYSVVRELIDNSLDAEGRDIKIIINNGGKASISVSDDGIGMSENDAVLSIQKHTTSKIQRIDDLNNISSMGFRGEALASICAVSDFTMVTRRESDEHGTKVTCSAGDAAHTEPAASNVGTVVTVQNLFHNLPARKKFLKSNRAESAKVKDEVLKKSLSFFDRSFLYKSDDRVIYSLSPQNEYKDRIEEIFGKRVRQNLLDIFHEEDLFSFHAYVSNIKSTLPSRSGQYLFINRRPVYDRSLFFALNGPCRGIVPSGRFLYAFVFINMDRSHLDINVHPAKKEVRIRPAQRLYSSLHSAVSRTLKEQFYTVPTLPGGKKIGSDVRHAGYDSEYRGADDGRVKEPSPYQALKWRKGEGGYMLPVQKIEPALNQHELFPSSSRELRFKGSLYNTYLIFEGKDYMLLVDQHAAHERILYERFSTEWIETTSQKSLLIPVNFTPPGNRYGVILEHLSLFKEAGIELEPFGDESFNVVSLPAYIPEKREEETLSLLFEDFAMGKVALTTEAIREDFIKLASCRSAVKEGDVLCQTEALSLMNDLLITSIPFVCPHGRPTMTQFSREYIEKLFKRR